MYETITIEEAQAHLAELIAGLMPGQDRQRIYTLISCLNFWEYHKDLSMQTLNFIFQIHDLIHGQTVPNLA